MFICDLQKEIFESSYQIGNETPDEMWRRVATFLASREKQVDYWAEKFYLNLKDYHTTLGGRILSNAGAGYEGTSMLNCFVLGPTQNPHGIDSIPEIYENLKEQALTLKTEGGWGYNFSHLRPRGALIRGIGIQSPGAIRFMELYDKSSEVITSGGGEQGKGIKGQKKKVRKGAQMGILGCWHPSILEFIRAKQISGKLTKFNLSVAITDDFMKAVTDDLEWKLIFPDTSDPNYNKLWNGNISEWEGKVEVYEILRARDLWDNIMKSSYDRAEPGVIFIDNVNYYNNLYYYETITACNPCGELFMGAFSSCLLGSINLVHFIKDDDWDYDKLNEYIPRQIRMMDNVIDLTYLPLEKQVVKLKEVRRLGMGILGYGSAFYMLGIKYGSRKALKLTEELMSFIANHAYRASADLAEEKGCFPAYDKEKYWKSNYVNQSLTLETIEYCKQRGMRNSHLLAIAPTGNTSVYAGVVSGGLEPVFAKEYTRTVIVTERPEGLETSRYWEGELEERGLFKWTKEGDDDILKTVELFEGYYYKIDENRGLTKETVVKDYGWRFCKDPKAAVTTADLTVKQHIDTMKIFAKYCDSAASKTVNIPHDYPYEDFKDIYIDAWKAGIKGITTYREGTMASVLSLKEEKESHNGLEETILKYDVKIPDNYEAKGVVLRAEGKKWYLHVPWLPHSDRPFALFVSTNHPEPTVITANTLEVLEELAREKEIPEEWIESNKAKCITQKNATKIARAISLLLRHGVAIKNIISALDKVEISPGTFVFQIKRYLASFLKNGTPAQGECPQCGSKKLIFVQGCKECTECRMSLCG